MSYLILFSSAFCISFALSITERIWEISSSVRLLRSGSGGSTGVGSLVDETEARLLDPNETTESWMSDVGVVASDGILLVSFPILLSKRQVGEDWWRHSVMKNNNTVMNRDNELRVRYSERKTSNLHVSDIIHRFVVIHPKV